MNFSYPAYIHCSSYRWPRRHFGTRSDSQETRMLCLSCVNEFRRYVKPFWHNTGSCLIWHTDRHLTIAELAPCISQCKTTIITGLPAFNPLTPYFCDSILNHTIWVKQSCNFWHPGTLTLRTDRHSARISKITNDGLTQYGTGCFISVPIWQQWASKS